MEVRAKEGAPIGLFPLRLENEFAKESFEADAIDMPIGFAGLLAETCGGAGLGERERRFLRTIA